MRDLRTEVISIGHALSFTTDDTDVQVFVKDLRGTEALGIGCTDVEVLRGIVAQGSSWAEDGLLYSRVLIEARTEQEAPTVVLPFDLGKLAGVANNLAQGRGEGCGGSTQVKAFALRLFRFPFS